MSNFDDTSEPLEERRARVRSGEHRQPSALIDEIPGAPVLAPTDEAGLVQTAKGADDRQQTSDGSGVSVPGLT